MFESYYQLNANPFRLSADESFRFAHKNYLKAWSHLSYALEQGEGFVMITGRPGSGKTTLIRDILSQLDASKVFAINLVTNQLQAEELLRKVALEYGLPAESYNKATLLTRIQDYVENEFQSGRRAVIVIDEAQNLTLNGLEELRLLSNLQSGSNPLFQIILVGQEELRGVILSPEMEHIRQRLIASCNIEPMNVEQTEGYIEHRLGIVGWHGDPGFDASVFPLIHHLTGGVPRKINHVVGRLLLYGALEEIHDFTLDDVWIVAKELLGEERLTLKAGQSFEEYQEEYLQSVQPVDDVNETATRSGDATSATTDNSGPISQAPTLVMEESAEPEGYEDPTSQQAGGYEEEDTATIFPQSEEQADGQEAENPASELERELPEIPEPDRGASDVTEVITTGEEDVTVRNRQNNEGFNANTASQTEEILNLPSMKAEKRKHDIEARGGLINTNDTLESSEMLSGGLGRSLRHILIIVVLGSAVMGWYVMKPEQFAEFWARTTTWLHSPESDQTAKIEIDDGVDERPSIPANQQVESDSGSDDPATLKNQATQIASAEMEIDSSTAAVIESDTEGKDLPVNLPSNPDDDFIATQTRYEKSTVEPTPVTDLTGRTQKFQVFFKETDEDIPKQFDGMMNDLFIVLSLNKKARLKIRGYTDPSAQPLDAMREALARAQRVSRYFLDKGIEQSRIQVESHSIMPKEPQAKPGILDEKLSQGRVEMILNGG